MIVYVSGSHKIIELDAPIKAKLDSIISKKGKIILGDRYGLDLAVQNYLCSKKYKDVAIFHEDVAPFYNVGSWPAVHVDGFSAKEKEKAMTMYSTVCFIIWDGQSRGTARNIARARYLGKDVVILQPGKKAYLLKGSKLTMPKLS